MTDQVLDVTALLGINNKQETPEIDSSVCDVDAGNLTVFNYQERPKDMHLTTQATLLMQVLVDSLFSLPAKKVKEGAIVELPEVTMVYPREKPLPAPKAPTKWEKFAAQKGIKKKSQKRSKKVWDPVSKEYKYRYGSRSANNVREAILEHKEGALVRAGAEDPFHLKQMEKKKRVDKNKNQQRVNRVKAAQEQQKKDLPGLVGITNSKQHKLNEIKRAVAVAQKSNASVGFYDEKAKDEPKIKRARKHLTTARTEKKTQDRIVRNILKRKHGELDIAKGVGKEMYQERKKRRLNDD